MHSTREIRQEPALTRFIWLLPLVFLVAGTVIRFLAIRFQLPDANPVEYVSRLCRWDCIWYIGMAEDGYSRFPVPDRVAAANWAFFPFYPLLVGTLGKLIPIPTIWLASLLSLALSYAAIVAAWPLLRSRRAYVLYAAFILAGPFSIYFTTFMTEVMFVLLATLVFRFLNRSDYLAAAGASALLSATRIVGVFASLAIGLQAVLDHFRRGGTWRNLLPGLLGQPQLVLAIFLAPLGCFVYMAFLHGWVGDALAFSHVQRAWDRTVANPGFYLWQGLTAWPPEGQLTPTTAQLLALAAILGFAITLVLAWRRQWPAALVTFLCVIIPLAAGLASMVRFMAGMPTVTITVMTLLARNRVVFALSLIFILVSAWFVTLGWLGGNLALV